MDPNDPTRPEADELFAAGHEFQSAQPQDQEDASFSQRLRQRYGEDVDPGISLEGSGATDDSGASERRLERLAEQGSSARYELRGQIARGGMGAVLRVWDEDLRRHLAMKVIAGGSEQLDLDSAPRVDSEKLSRFLEEAQITGQLDHPSIVPVHDLGIGQSGRVYFTMPLIKGRDLKQVFERVHDDDQHWTRARCLDVFLKICDAMAFAHSKGVLHRDLKPSNVMVGRFGEVYVMDWGLAKVLGREDHHDVRPRDDTSQASFVRTDRRDDVESDPDSPVVTMDGDVVGTPAYMSPEQAQGKAEALDERSDVYSVGSMLYHMLSGRMPYVAPGERVSPYTVLNAVRQGPPTSLHQIDPLLDPELVAVCEMAMARDARRRYEGMESLASDLRAFQEGRVVAAYESGPWARFRKWIVRNRGLATAIGLALLVSFGGLLALLIQSVSTNIRVGAANDELKLSQSSLTQSLASERDARDEADAQRELADLAAAEAERRAQQARRESYAGNLIAADLSLRLNQVAEARRRLESCQTDLRGWEWQHLHLRADTSLWSSALSGKPPWRVLSVPDGQHLVVVSDQAVDVIDPDLGTTTESWYTRGQSVRACALSGDGLMLAVSTSAGATGGAGQVLLYSIPDGSPLHSFEVPDDEITALAFASAPQRLVLGDEKGRLTEWWIDQPNPRQLGNQRRRAITALEISEDGMRLAVGDRSGNVRLSWLEEMEWRTEFERQLHEGAVRDLAFTRDGDTLISVSDDGTGRILRTVDAELLTVLSGHGAGLTAVAFGGDGDEWVATASRDATVRIGNTSSGRQRAVLRGHESLVQSLAVWSNNERVLTCDQGGRMRAWDPQWSRASLTVDAHRGSVRSLAFLSGGEQLVSVSDDHAAMLWDLSSGEAVNADRGHAAALTTVATHDGEVPRVAVGAVSGGLRVWTRDLQSAPTHMGHAEMSVNALAFDPSGERLAAACEDDVVRIYSIPDGELVQTLVGHTAVVTALAWTPDGRGLATGSLDESVRVWEIASGDELGRLEEEQRWIKDVVIDAAGRWLAAAGHDGRVLVYELSTGALANQLGSSGQPINRLSFSSTGDRLAGAGGDGRVHIWHLPSGVKLLTLDVGPEGGALEELGVLVSAVAFSPTDDRLVAGVSSGPPWARQGRILVWETGPAESRIRTRRASATLQEAVRPIVEAAFDEFPTVSAVLEALRVEDLLRGEMRTEAERMVRTAGHENLYQRAWAEALPLDLPRSVYEQALDRAEAALSAVPGEPRYLLACSLARFRLQFYGSALSDLEAVAAVLLPPAGELHLAHDVLLGLVQAQLSGDVQLEQAANALARANATYDQLRASGSIQAWMEPLLAELTALVPE